MENIIPASQDNWFWKGLNRCLIMFKVGWAMSSSQITWNFVYLVYLKISKEGDCTSFLSNLFLWLSALVMKKNCFSQSQSLIWSACCVSSSHHASFWRTSLHCLCDLCVDMRRLQLGSSEALSPGWASQISSVSNNRVNSPDPWVSVALHWALLNLLHFINVFIEGGKLDAVFEMWSVKCFCLLAVIIQPRMPGHTAGWLPRVLSSTAVSQPITPCLLLCKGSLLPRCRTLNFSILKW